MRNFNIQKAGIAKQTNPIAVADGRPVDAMYDDVGRQVMILHQVRDLITTAQATLSNGTPTSLLAGVSGVFHDLVYLTAANQSDAAVTMILKDDGTTAKTFQLPANNTSGLSLSTPIPQGATGGNWEVDLEDITGTTVSIDALFIKNI